MKTENTPENKAKFFAQYWGQIVLLDIETGINHVMACLDSRPKRWVLELKPLKNISDEDANKVAKMLNIKPIEKANWGVNHLIKLIETGCSSQFRPLSGFEALNVYDYLRSKSYLLPYMDLSTEDLISYGWVKEKNHERNPNKR